MAADAAPAPAPPGLWGRRGQLARKAFKALQVQLGRKALPVRQVQLRRGGKGTVEKCRKSCNNVRNSRNIAIITMK